MDNLSKKTNFVIRLTKNLLIYKQFIKTNDSELIINRKGYKIKLVKYIVDNNTRQIIKDKYKGVDESTDDDTSIFVIATNLVSLSYDTLINLYKERWNIEICNKNIKSNFNIRHIVKQSNSSDPINKIGFYTCLSFLLYNITMLEKKLLEKKKYLITKKETNINYCQHVSVYKDYLIDKINPCNTNIILTEKRKEHRILMNKISKHNKKTVRNNTKKGKYKALKNMAKINCRDDILVQIDEYYKKIKKNKINRRYMQYTD